MDAERRQVTVLFTDMVGFTSFSERAGEEAAFTLMQTIAGLMEDAVQVQGGSVQGFTGDGIMAIFGVPVALEDAPLRACRAALSIHERLAATADALETKFGVRPRMRIGINTGVAVVGRLQVGEEASATVLGDTVNVAARLQTLAEPNTILLSETTYRLTQGLIEASFTGAHSMKGKAEPQKAYRLDSIRQGVTRFETAVGRGLSAYVGRERELDVLERGLADVRSQLCVIDLAAEPGMGKSRLLHEFRQRIGNERAFVFSGSCSPDGLQTPFKPFIEVVRGSFQVGAGEGEREVTNKLEIGLAALGLQSTRNLGLLLHLLGLKVPDGALTGLDGVLIGLRTRELLQQLLEARCRLSPVVMVIEDLHWIDSVSEELLGKIVDSEAKFPLLLLHSRRPEYVPAWLDRSVVTKVHLEPLPADAISRLVQARIGATDLPAALAQQVTEKADGNPLFAEEIVSFLIERGMVRITAGTLEFDARAIAVALPASVQSLLTARVDRLAPKDRALLQAASVIGRRFDPGLLAVVSAETGEIDASLSAMQALDLVRLQDSSSGYEFKHALVREALYQSLLTEARQMLHLKIAKEIERRSSNRLAEVAEVLAHHYSQTALADKAFAFLAMAGDKSLSVYSLDEAGAHFAAALALLDKNQDCASDEQVAEFLVSYTLLLNVTIQLRAMIGILERYTARIARLGDDPRAVLIRYHYVAALLRNTRYREAAAVQREISLMADRLADSRSKAYSLVGAIHVSTLIAPKPFNEFEILKREAIKAASETADAYIQSWNRFVIGWEEFNRGRMNDARDTASELMQVGRQLDDPRSTGLGLVLLAWVSWASEAFAEALEYSERAMAAAVTPWDQALAFVAKGGALVSLRRTDEGARLLEEGDRRCIADGDIIQSRGSAICLGVCKIFQGDIGGGIRCLEEVASTNDKEGYRAVADFGRLNLCEVYLQIIMGEEKLPFLTLLRNLPILLKVMATASSRIPKLVTRILENPQFDPDGYIVGRARMMLGLLYKAKKKHRIAAQHLTDARQILLPFGRTSALARVDAALAELG